MATLSRAAMDEIRRHCAQEFPDECCGVVIADAAGCQRVMRVRNVQNEMHAKDPEHYPRTARIAYAGHPGDLRVALEAADVAGSSLLAFYHSHPDHDAYFSAEDTAQATPLGEPSYPEALQIVVSIYDREIRTIKVFAWSHQTGAYVETAFEEK